MSFDGWWQYSGSHRRPGRFHKDVARMGYEAGFDHSQMEMETIVNMAIALMVEITMSSDLSFAECQAKCRVVYHAIKNDLKGLKGQQ